jgi:hypothetical protein
LYALDPWDGERKYDLPAGIVACTIANANRGKEGKAFQPKDFMPKFGVDPADDSDSGELSVEEQISFLKGMSARKPGGTG